MLTFTLYAFLISFITLLVVIYLTHKYNLFMDTSEDEKPQNYHTDTTPRAGGIGLISGMILLLFTPLGVKLVISLILAFVSGIFEDFHNSLSPKLRLILQFISAFAAVLLTDSVVTYLGLGITMPYILGVIFSIFAIMGMMNAINIIDGFNGLASSVSLLILSSFAFIAYSHNAMDILHIIAITVGSLLGFFILNFPKGKIFLGDGGAYLLGFIIALIGISLASTYDDVSPWYMLSVLIYPVWEVLFSIIRKVSIGLSPMQPDAYHLHMLIYRHITQNNPLTALFIFIAILPANILSTLYSHSSLYNIIIASIFILLYISLYVYLYKKDTKS